MPQYHGMFWSLKIMKNRKPLEEAMYSQSLDAFIEKVAKLGFSFEGIGLPEMLVLETNVTSSAGIRDLTDASIAVIEQFLEHKNATGGLITNLDYRQDRVNRSATYLLVTLLPYKLIPKPQ